MYDLLCCMICVFAVYGLYAALCEMKMFFLRRAQKAAMQNERVEKESCSCTGECPFSECSECIGEIQTQEDEDY